MKRQPRRAVTGGMRVDAYAVLCRAVEEGVAYGWQRAHKHVEAPGRDAVLEQIERAVLDAVCAYFAFDDTEPA